jgi:serine/threonine protein phosphatase PrpC
MESLLFEWTTRVAKKLNNKITSEDYAAFSDDQGYYIVADGVSRDVYNQKGYSLARDAAERAVNASINVFSKQIAPEFIKEAFIKANNAVRQLNIEKGLWGFGNHNYLDRDLVGTCLACLIWVRDTFHYGYIGDCRIANISSNGSFFITPDQVAKAKSEFPQEGPLSQRVITIRKDRRNNPAESHTTYGVLTGEDAALDSNYLGFGSFKPSIDSVTAICSDGVAPFIENNLEFRELLLKGNSKGIQDYIAESVSPYQNTDEKTLILCKL